MPKHRKRNPRKGAKSTSIKTKFKIGGRKSGQGALQMNKKSLMDALKKCRPRDKGKLINQFNRLLSASGSTLIIDNIIGLNKVDES